MTQPSNLLFSFLTLVVLPNVHYTLSFPVINSHPCLYELINDPTLYNYSNGEILSCQRDGNYYHTKTRTGTLMKDEATLECLSLLHISKKSFANVVSSSMAILFPSVIYYSGPALQNKTSVCVVEYFAYSTQGLDSYVIKDMITVEALYQSILAFLDLLSALKNAEVRHNDINSKNVVVLRRYHSPGYFFSFLLVDFSFSLSPSVRSSPLVDSFANHLQKSRISSAPSSGPLSDIYSVAIIIKTMLSRYSMSSTGWAYPLVNLMLNGYGDEMWDLQGIANLKTLLNILYNDNKSNLGTLQVFSDNVVNINKYRNHICTSCATFRLIKSKDGGSVCAQLGDLIEIGYSDDLSTRKPIVHHKYLNEQRLGIVKPVFDSLLLSWDHLEVSVVDISGGFSAICIEIFLNYNASCTIFETEESFQLGFERFFDEMNTFTNPQNAIRYRNIGTTSAQPFEADIITLLGESLWLHYCVEGSLEHVIKKFAARAREVLIVEWVDPNDEVLSRIMRKYPSCQEEMADSPYSRLEFKKSLESDFCGLTSFALGELSESRYISLNIKVFNPSFFQKFGLNKTDNKVSPQWKIKSAKNAKYERLKTFYNGLVVHA